MLLIKGTAKIYKQNRTRKSHRYTEKDRNTYKVIAPATKLRDIKYLEKNISSFEVFTACLQNLCSKSQINANKIQETYEDHVF